MTTSSTLRTGSTPRRTTSLAALMALVVAFSFGFVASASAAPTPVQSPSATPTDPGTPDPTADPDVTPSTSSSPAPSTPALNQDPTTPAPSTPAPSESKSADADADEDAEPGAETEASDDDEASTPSGKDSSSRVKVSSLRSKLLSARSGPFASTGITPNVAVSEGGNLLSLSLPGCAPAGGTATLDELIGFIDEDQVSQDESLDWVIDGPALGSPLTGTVSFDEGIGEFSVTGLEQGDYTLVFSLEGGVQLEDAFTVIGCVTTTVSCAAISFTNPSTNPPVSVAFGPVIDGDVFDDESGDSVEVAPGRTVTGYIGYANIGWSAYWTDPVDFDGGALPDGIFRISSAGDVEDVAIPQAGCAASVTSVESVCSSGGELAQSTLTIAKLEPLTLYYEVWERSARYPAADGEIAAGSATASETVSLRADKDYEVRLYVENAEDLYEVSDLDVGDCPGPSSAPSADDGDPSDEPTAVDDDPTAGGTEPVSGGGAVLADTGASTGPLGLMGIALLLATGAALVIKGRRSQLS